MRQKYKGFGKRGQPRRVKGEGSIPAQHLFMFFLLLALGYGVDGWLAR